MGVMSNNASRLGPLRISAGGAERRQAPRYEAIGPGEIRNLSDDVLGTFRLIDESRGGIGCVGPLTVEAGQTVRLRIGTLPQWREATVVSVNPCGPLRRLSMRFTQQAARAAA